MVYWIHMHHVSLSMAHSVSLYNQRRANVLLGSDTMLIWNKQINCWRMCLILVHFVKVFPVRNRSLIMGRGRLFWLAASVIKHPLAVLPKIPPLGFFIENILSLISVQNPSSMWFFVSKKCSTYHRVTKKVAYYWQWVTTSKCHSVYK